MQENPFRERITSVFCQKNKEIENLQNEGICFEEFLEMMSVFSEQAPRDLKVFYAFKIYGKNLRFIVRRIIMHTSQIKKKK